MATIPDALAIAIQHHNAGRLQAAEQIYRQILAIDPNQPDALHLLGVIASQTGRQGIAIEYIVRAIELKGNVAAFHLNLGVAFKEQGKLDEAIASYRRTLELNPDFAAAHFNLGVAYASQGKLDEAVASYRLALELKPDYAAALSNLAVALKDQGKLDEAIGCCRRALALNPDHAEAHNNLGVVFKEQGKLDEAAACYRRALQVNPGFAEAHYNLGVVFKEQGKLDEAVGCYRRALELNPDFAAAYNNLGVALKDQGRHDEAVGCCRRALALKPDHAEAHCNLGSALKEQGKLDDAIACYRRALQVNPNFAAAHFNLGVAFQEQGKLDDAVAAYGQAVALRPDYAEAHSNLGAALNAQGKRDEALACCRRALALKPDYAEAHNNLGSALKETGDLQGAEASFRAALGCDSRSAWAHYNLAEVLLGKLPQQDLAEQFRLLEETGLTEAQRLLLHFGLAQVLDARGEYAEAAGHLDRANALRRSEWRKRGQEYDAKEHALFIARMIAVCTPEFFARIKGFGLNSATPVFVVGLPRSGTTLIEQILAGHSRVFAAGEIQLVRDTLAALGGQGADCLEGLRQLNRATAQRLASQHLERLRALNPAALRIVDKMPDNYLSLGLLASLFPKAKLIHCRRDLRDVAVSCWMTHFQEVRWANDPEHIASRFREYLRIMEHWRKVLPAPLLEVRYEETVADLEAVARRIVAWCGLEWEAACLDFHQAVRPVSTASAVQVRQPLYATSVGRWRHYEHALATLLSAIPGGE